MSGAWCIALPVPLRTSAESSLVQAPIVSSFPPALHIPCFEDYAVVFCLLDIGMRT
jgi:hypothetical protein